MIPKIDGKPLFSFGFHFIENKYANVSREKFVVNTAASAAAAAKCQRGSASSLSIKFIG